ncbi:MAG TPA: response regulator [Bryobacteraceae bacterium]|jgi:CheY-like chemotaxis protein|nr:response regulator [Bryobacteraceae bacterium]
MDAATPQQTQDTKRILIVDDDPDIHQFLTVALQPTGCHVETASDGLEGLRRIESSPWDLVITDVIMPEMNGIELLERTHRVRPALPVVVMTVDSSAERIVTAIREHAYAWLQKPFSLQAIRDLVDTALYDGRLDNDIEIISASPRWLELRLRCDMKVAWRALHFLREMEYGLSPGERENVALAFRELLFNAIEHGGGSDPNVYVTVTYTKADGALLFRVRDPGPGFSFDRLRHAAISNPPDSPVEHVLTRATLGMRPGGFGILLTRSLVDELIYNEKGNEALLIRYNRPPPPG